MYIFTLGSVLWWLALVTHAWIMVILDAKYRPDSCLFVMRVLYWSFGWGFPLLGMIVGLSTYVFNADLAGFCFTVHDRYHELWFFWNVVIACECVGLLGLVTLLRAMYLSAKTVKSLKFWDDATRLLLLLCAALALTVFEAVFRFVEHGREGDYAASATTFVTCLVTGGTNCGNVPAYRPNHGYYMSQIFFDNIIGTVCFVTFGTMPSNFGLWRALLCGGGESRSRDKSQTEMSQTGKHSKSMRSARGASTRTKATSPTEPKDVPSTAVVSPTPAAGTDATASDPTVAPASNAV